LIGYPYVWGGTSSSEQTLFGVRSRGGFDCSGFAWRVYKLQAYPGRGRLAATLKGLTAAQIACDVPKRRRIAFADLQPGDLLFFGRAAAATSGRGRPHGDLRGWRLMIHSSRYGVALAGRGLVRRAVRMGPRGARRSRPDG
jgi:cell wall-associated NlpC family hydrolase